MKNLIFSFVLFFAVNTPVVYSFRFDGDHIFKYDDKIPDGYYFDKSITSPGSPWITKTRFGIPDTSIVKIELHDVNDSVIFTTTARLGGGNYYFDWQNIVSDSSFKSGVYYVVLNAELNKVNRKNPEMKFTGKTKIIVVR